MAVAVTYPGVYIQEIPSGLRTITGVATSITAFIGRAAFGPTDNPETIFSFGDFQERYGGLQYDYPLSYSVQDFFMNGGTQAVICRLYEPPDKATGVAQVTLAAPPLPTGWTITGNVSSAAANQKVVSAGASQAVIGGGKNAPEPGQQFKVGSDSYTVVLFNATSGSLLFQPALKSDTTFGTALDFGAPATASSAAELSLDAASPGSWGNRLNVTVDLQGLQIPALAQRAVQPYLQYGQAVSDLFNLTVTCQQPDGTTIVERFTNVTVKHGGAADKAPNRLDRVLAHQSNLVRVPLDKSGAPEFPANAPHNGDTGTGSGGADGNPLDIMTYLGNQDQQTGMYLLDKTDLFNLMVIPPDSRTQPNDVDPFVLQAAAIYCTQRRAMLIVDPPAAWTDAARQGLLDTLDPSSLGITGEVNGTETARNAAVYFPRVIEEDPVMNGQKDVFAPSGIIAGVMASTDASRGVWKAPAGLDAGLAGIDSLEVKLTDEQNGLLNPLGINCLRTFPVIGPVVWGARTLRGADILSDDYKYVPVRRLTLFIEESLYRGTKWAVFEPNDERLWSSLRLAVNGFLADLSRQGAFYTYNVACDASTTSQSDIDHGIVNILVQIAPVKPAEFVVISIQQIAGQKQS